MTLNLVYRRTLGQIVSRIDVVLRDACYVTNDKNSASQYDRWKITQLLYIVICFVNLTVVNVTNDYIIYLDTSMKYVYTIRMNIPSQILSPRTPSEIKFGAPQKFL
jgi:hypothetical protein